MPARQVPEWLAKQLRMKRYAKNKAPGILCTRCHTSWCWAHTTRNLCWWCEHDRPTKHVPEQPVPSTKGPDKCKDGPRQKRR